MRQFVCFVASSSRTYRVYLGKHNLVKDEAGSIAISPAKIIVHERWDPYRIRYADISPKPLGLQITLCRHIHINLQFLIVPFASMLQ